MEREKPNFDILGRIDRERLARGWSEYTLAENSGLTQSTLSTWRRRNLQPNVTSIEKKTVFTEGMKCSECAKKLWNSLNKIEELSVKKVNFKNGTAVLEASRNISDEEIKSAVESAGYKFIKTIP